MGPIKNAYNNSPNIIGFPIPTHTEDWYEFRTVGIEGYEGGFGASEIGDLCGKSHPKYRKILPILLEEKAGMRIPERKVNEQMLSGILAEPMIKDRWQYHDGTDFGYIQNYFDGNIIRQFRDVNMYLVNIKFPWLFCSLDASILPGPSLMSGHHLDREHPLECKQLSYFAAQTWEHKIPAQYIYQIHQQMLITETQYCELAVLQDGYNFKVYPFELNVEIAQEILETSREKWEMVKILRKKGYDMAHYKEQNQWSKAERIQSEIDSMMPLPDESEGWKEFLADRYINEVESFQGSIKDFKEVLRAVKLKMAIKVLEEHIDLLENRHRARFVTEQAEYMDFNSSGRVRCYRKKVKGGGMSNPILDYRGIRTKPDTDLIRALIQPLIN